MRSGSDIGIAGLSVSLVRQVMSAVFTDLDERFPDERVVATTAADGSFRVAGLSVASDSLRIGGPGWMDAKVEIDEDSPTQAGRVEIQPALELAGRVEFPGGRPCANVDVAVYDVDPDSDDARQAREVFGPPGDPSVLTECDGTFHSGCLAAGRYWLEFRGGTPQVIRRVAGPFDAGTRDLRVELVCGSTIRGRVVGPDGQPAERVAVRARADGRQGTSGDAKSDRTGAFVIGGLDRGPHIVELEADGFLTWTRAGVRVEGDALAVRLDEGLAVAGVLRSADAGDETFVHIVVEPVDAEQPAETRRGQTDVNGHFRVTALTKGRWRLRIDGDPPPVVLPETVVEAGSESLELRTQPRPPAPVDETKDDEAPADDGR